MSSFCPHTPAGDNQVPHGQGVLVALKGSIHIFFVATVSSSNFSVACWLITNNRQMCVELFHILHWAGLDRREDIYSTRSATCVLGSRESTSGHGVRRVVWRALGNNDRSDVTVAVLARPHAAIKGSICVEIFTGHVVGSDISQGRRARARHGTRGCDEDKKKGKEL